MSKKKKKRYGTPTQSKKESKKQTVGTLQKENRHLRRQVEALKKELAEQRGERLTESEERPIERLFKHQASNGILYAKKGFLAYLYALIRHSFAFRLYFRILTYIRRFRFLTYTVTLLGYILAFAEAGALLLLSTSALVITLPLSVAISQILFLLSLVDRRKANQVNAQLLKNKRVILLFPPRHGLKPNSYLAGMAREYAEDPNTVSIVVSPFLLSDKGLTQQRKHYWVSRIEGERILLIRRSYYFTLKKQFFDTLCTDITEIY